MNTSITIERTIHLAQRGRGAPKRIVDGEKLTLAITGRVPRIARLMALAIKFDGVIQEGAVADYAALARLAHVTRARITQIMNLLLLAPDIQEQILFLPSVEKGRDPIHLRQLQQLALATDWRKQRKMWLDLRPAA